MQRIKKDTPAQRGLVVGIMLFGLIIAFNTASLQSLQMSANSIFSGQQSASAKMPSSKPYWYGGGCSNNTQVLQNSGARTFIDVKPQYVKGFLAFWVSESFSNNLWAQVGYYIYRSSVPIGFYQIWNMTPREEVSTGTTTLRPGMHSFSFVLLSGGKLAFKVDEVTFASYNIGQVSSSASYPLCSLSEEGYSPAPFSFSPVTFKVAMQVLRSGTWSDVNFANSFGNSWGIEGQMQNSSLPTNEIVVGSNLNIIPSSSQLWA